MLETLPESTSDPCTLPTAITLVALLEGSKCHKTAGKKEILMDTSKDVEKEDSKLDASEIFTMGPVSQETKGIHTMLESPIGNPGGQF